MRRYEIDRPRTIREHRRHMRQVHSWPKKPVECICDLQAGRFRKKDAYDCGRTKCLICHAEKVLKIPSVKDLIRRDRAKASMADYLTGL